MRFFIAIALAATLLYASHVAGQPATNLPPSDASRNFIAVKALGTPTLLLFNSMIGSVGIEYSFHKQHSIGVSAAYFEIREKFSYNDSTQKAKGYPYQRHIERGIMLYYRYYTRRWWPVSDNFIRPYVSGFMRIGNADKHFDEQFETSQVKYDEQQYSVGAVFGTLLSIQAGRLCLDANLGPFYKWRMIRDEHLDNTGADVVSNRKEHGPGIKVGFTLSYVFQRGK